MLTGSPKDARTALAEVIRLTLSFFGASRSYFAWKSS
jgi:hypothetical protein